MNRLGWKPDLPDFRDHMLTILHPPQPMFKAGALPVEWDITARTPKIWDQQDIGSCVAHGVARAAALAEFKEKSPNPAVASPSRMFIYYNGRVIEHTVDEDSGLTVRDGMKAIAKCGIPPETDWPYDTTRFTDKPPPEAYASGAKEEARQYLSVDQTVSAIKLALAWNWGIAGGFVLYESFDSLAVEQTGIVPMPKASERMIGGHCVCLTGWSDKRHAFQFDNSWSDAWGGQSINNNGRGRGFFPYEYVVNRGLSSSFWTVHKVD